MKDLKDILKELRGIFSMYTTVNIAFRELAKSDVFPLHEATKHPNFNKHLSWQQPTNISETIIEVNDFLEDMSIEESVMLSIVEKHTGTWIGNIRIKIYRDSFALSLWIHSNYWNTPMGIKALESIITIIFQESELPHVYARVLNDYKLMEKVMSIFKFDKIGQEIVLHNNKSELNCNVYQLKKINWNRVLLLEKY